MSGATSSRAAWISELEPASFEGGEFCWYAIETRHRYEKRVAQQLLRRGMQTFVPEREEVRQWSDRKKRVSIPLFAGYVFVWMPWSRATRLRVLQTAGVIGFVTLLGRAVPVPAEQIEHLRRLLQQKVACSLHAFLKVGRRVRVRGGCLDGLEGILAECGESNLAISIECLQRSLLVHLEGYELEFA
jgi:transcription antitermination factor NusG